LAIKFDLAASYPSEAAFKPTQIRTATGAWEYHRSPGSGGANYGDDHDAAAGDVVVGVEYNVISDTNVVAGADYHIHTVTTGIINVPVGFSVAGCAKFLPE